MALDDISSTSMTAVTKAPAKSVLWIQDNTEMKCLAPEIHNYALFAQISADGEWRLIRPKSCDNAILTKLLGVLHDYANKEGLVPPRAWGRELPTTVPAEPAGAAVIPQPTMPLPVANGPKLIRNTIAIPGPKTQSIPPPPKMSKGDVPL